MPAAGSSGFMTKITSSRRRLPRMNSSRAARARAELRPAEAWKSSSRSAIRRGAVAPIIANSKLQTSNSKRKLELKFYVWSLALPLGLNLRVDARGLDRFHGERDHRAHVTDVCGQYECVALLRQLSELGDVPFRDP